MKKPLPLAMTAIVLSLFSLLTHAVPQAAKSGPATATLQLTQCALKVSGWTCDGCAKATVAKLLKLDGVKEAKADFKTGRVQVSYNAQKTTPEKIVAVFNKNSSGFRAKVAAPKER